MMRFLPSSSRSGFTLAVRAALVVTAVGILGACDRHSAEEVPENYGHGSSHARKLPDHQADSTGRDHFSDTGGLKEEGIKREENRATPAPSVSSKGF